MIEKDIREAAKITSDILMELAELAKPEVSLDMLNEIAEGRIKERGAEPFNKGYHPKWAETPYPATICASVNEEVCHAPPAGRVLHEGDIVTFDLAISYKSAAGDAALTVPVGEIDNRKQRLLRYNKRALEEGIAVVKAGTKVKEIGKAIAAVCLINGYQSIKEYGGHGIGEKMHMPPAIPGWDNPKNPDREKRLEEGQVICIEPMLTPGIGRIGIYGEDKWTVFCLDRQPCAMMESMVRVGKNGPEVLTHHIKF